MKNCSLFWIQSIVFCLAICLATVSNGQIPPPPIIDPINGVKTTKGGNEGNTDPSKANNTTDKAKELKAAEDKVKTDIEKEKEAQKKEDDEKDILAKKRLSTLPDAKVWGQNFFRDQSISFFQRSRDAKALDSYILSVGDELSITVWGVVDFSKSTAINEEGYIDLTIPNLLVPRLYVRGMKFAEVKAAIHERLSNHMNMRGSQMDVQINYSRNITVNITGEVFNPGSYTIPAVNTAFNALVASGGPSQIGSVRNIKVVSSSKATRILDIYKFALNPNIADEFFLTNNDYIFVPIAGRVVEIKGSVRRPFFYELIEGENLRDALTYAGGLEADAYLRNVQIKRYDEDEERIIDVNLGKLLSANGDFTLKDGDVVTISALNEAYSNYVTVSGAVKLPGEYELKKDVRIHSILTQAGIMLSAVMDRIYVKRIQPDFSIKYYNINVDSIMYHPESESNILLRALDDIEVKFKSDFVDAYNIQLDGAIRRPGKYRHSDSLSLADLIYLGNGIKNEAALSLVEVSRLVQNPDGTTKTVIEQFKITDSLSVEGADNFLLQPYDQVFVRLSKGFEFPKNVQIDGEIFFPGTYTLLNRTERVSDLLKRAGGLTEIAFLQGAQLYRAQEGFVVINLAEVLRDSTSKFNYFLKEGDVLTIPKIKDLVAIAGRVNHPHVKEESEIAEMELKIALMKMKTDIEKEEMLLKDKMAQAKNPRRINAPYHKYKHANFYVKHYAGGVDRENGGRKSLIYVRYANGAVKKTKSFLFFKSFPRVEKGAMVYVETKTRNTKIKENKRTIDWNVVIKDSIAIATSGLTLYALIRAITTP